MKILINRPGMEAHVWETNESFHDLMVWWGGRNLDDFSCILKSGFASLPGKVRSLTKKEARNFKYNYWDGNCYLGELHNTWLNLRRNNVYYKMPSASLHYAAREYPRRNNSRNYSNDRNRR